VSHSPLLRTIELLTRPREQHKRIVLEELSAFRTIPDGDRIDESFPLTESPKEPSPTSHSRGKQRSDPHAGFVYYRTENPKPGIVSGQKLRRIPSLEPFKSPVLGSLAETQEGVAHAL